MAYTCTNPACTWRDKDPKMGLLLSKYSTATNMGEVCPKCGFQVEDLDFLERVAIREEAPMSREDAERLAREDLEKWREL